MARLDVVFDWDKGTEWSYYDGNDIRTANRHDLLTLEFWTRFEGKTVGVEKAHLMHRNDQSVAQIYTHEELIQIVAASHGVKIWLLPESQSFRARDAYQLGKDRITEAYFKLFNDHPEITLQAFPVIENIDRKEALQAIKVDSNKILNKLRPEYNDVLVDKAAEIIDRAFDSLTENAKQQFQIKRSRKGVKFNCPSIMSVFSVVKDRDGKTRLHKGKFIGVDTVMRVLTQNPYKGKKSGTARSNLMMHWQQKRVLKGLPREEWKLPRSMSRRALKELIKVFRDAA